MINFSQNNEQSFILSYFKDHEGSFLDIGANDGITLSNTYALVQQGWHGTLVEASPRAYDRLCAMHANNGKLVLLKYAIGSKNDKIILHESGELLGKGDIALVSSTKEEETKRWESLKMPFEDVEVDMIDFKTMMTKTRHTAFDFVSIDIEGMEKEVVPQIDFAALKTKMAIIEFNGKDEDFFTNYMNPFGFKLIHKNAENLIYAL